ncbi:MAG: hypothetical protein LBP59_16360 [Planctomycetaceae bacterium]|jgi:hypothetical protein|nr:hypothetical protein [Planctomycetaceae bacterium]
MQNSTYLFILGVMIVIISFILQLRKRYKTEAAKKKKLYADIAAAQKERREELIQKGEDPKKKLGESDLSRVPLGEPFRNKFSGSAAQSQIGKWETEMFTLSRQLIGQIDSKMVAIETLTLEANRTANRLELLIEHFENIIDKIENNNKNKSNETINNITQFTKHNQTQQQETIKKENEIIQQNPEQQPKKFKDYIKELTTEINEFQDKIDDFGTLKDVTILKPITDKEKITTNNNAEFNNAEIKNTEFKNIEIKNTEIKNTPEKTETNHNPLSLSPPRLPGENITENFISNVNHTPKNNQKNNQPSNLAIDEFFNNTQNNVTKNNPAPNATPPNRQQITMLANYGYSTKEIAQNLNIPIGEVELILESKKIK